MKKSDDKKEKQGSFKFMKRSAKGNKALKLNLERAILKLIVLYAEIDKAPTFKKFLRLTGVDIGQLRRKHSPFALYSCFIRRAGLKPNRRSPKIEWCHEACPADYPLYQCPFSP